jgi:NurA-like 5'-3' nuclease
MYGAARDAADAAVWQWREGVKAALKAGTPIPNLRTSKAYSNDDLVAALHIYGSNAADVNEIYNENLLECRDEVLAELRADDDANAIELLKQQAIADRKPSLADLTPEQNRILQQAVQDRLIPEELLRDPTIPIALRREIADVIPASAWADELEYQRGPAGQVEQVEPGDESDAGDTGDEGGEA